MPRIDERELASIVSRDLQLSIAAEQIGRTEEVELRLVGLGRPHGFSIRVRAGLQLVFGEVVWDGLALPLVAALGVSSADDWRAVSSLRSAYARANLQTTMTVNGEVVEAGQTESAQASVTSMELRSQTVNWRSTVEESAADVCVAVLTVLLHLLPVEREVLGDESANDNLAEIEGQASQVLTTRYERSRVNRAAAILLHGTRCKVCGTDFEEKYGRIGKGYVEVHHLLPVHLMAGPMIVDPATDLIPLCANCHRMAHTEDPPIAPSVLMAALGESPRIF